MKHEYIFKNNTRFTRKRWQKSSEVMLCICYMVNERGVVFYELLEPNETVTNNNSAEWSSLPRKVADLLFVWTTY